jgi:hypothetical protein
VPLVQLHHISGISEAVQSSFVILEKQLCMMFFFWVVVLCRFIGRCLRENGQLHSSLGHMSIQEAYPHKPVSEFHVSSSPNEQAGCALCPSSVCDPDSLQQELSFH